jgi:hypothetical protein
MMDSFLRDLGHFYGLWSALESSLDYMIGRLLKIPHVETHILTVGMEFGRKANLLRTLLARSDHPEKDRIRSLLRKIQNEARRNIFTHSIMHSDAESVTFVHRKMDGDYTGTPWRFTGEEFRQHVSDITAYAGDLSDLLGIDEADFQAFGRAASTNTRSSSTTSPHPPSSSA